MSAETPVTCPANPLCKRTTFVVTRDESQGEFVLRCEDLHEVRRFFTLVPPPPPPPPEPSSHAARSVHRPPR
jgi:hypothetical protein